MSISEFSITAQLSAIALYVGTDVILRFAYDRLLFGEQGFADDSSDIVAYEKPFFVSWCCYNLFAVFGLLVVWPYAKFVQQKSLKDYFTQQWCGQLSLPVAISYALPVTICLFFQNAFYVMALKYLRPPTAAALGQTECPFTVALSVLVLHRSFNARERIGIISCFAGIACIVLPPVFRRNNTQLDGDVDTTVDDTIAGMIWGSFYTIVAAAAYAIYQVFWLWFDNLRFPKTATLTATTDNFSMAQPPQDTIAILVDAFASMALMGILNFCILWIPIPLFHFTGVESFELPEASQLGPVFIASALSATVDATNAIACVVSSAVLVAMAYPLNIPLSVLFLLFWDGTPISEFGSMGWLGTVLVLCGIFFLETEEDSCTTACTGDDILEMVRDDSEDHSYMPTDADCCKKVNSLTYSPSKRENLDCSMVEIEAQLS